MDPFVESWGEILRPQALDLALVTGFLALALVSFFRKSVRLRFVTFIAAVGYLLLLFAFARGLGEFGATILVAGNIPGRTQTLALALFQRVQVGRDREALGLAVLSVVLAAAALVLSEILVHRRDRTLSR